MAQPYRSGPGRPPGSFERARELGIEPVGAVLAGLGVVLVLAAFTWLPWFRPGFISAQGPGFADVRHELQAIRAEAAPLGGRVSVAASLPYFTWVGWLLLALAAVAAALAVSRIGAAHWSVRWLAAVVGAIGIGASFIAMDLVTVAGTPPAGARPPGYGSYLAHSGPGFWAAATGFLLLVIGSLVRSRAAED